MKPLSYYANYLKRISERESGAEVYRKLVAMPATEAIKLIDEVQQRIADDKLNEEIENFKASLK